MHEQRARPRRRRLQRQLTAAEREACFDGLIACAVAPETVARRAVAEAVLHLRAPRFDEVVGPRSLVAHIALASRADGIALGRHVFIRRQRLLDTPLEGPGAVETLRLPLDLVAHEVTHVAQYLRDGVAGFLVRYGAAYAAGLARGLGDRNAYLAIPHEREARRVAMEVSRR